jgi:cytochrome c-type biogenesis protein
MKGVYWQMQYIIAFLEGIITFISPCLLPMLPIYISYFAGGGERSAGKTLKGALGFVTGFTLVFMVMGALAGTVGSFLREYRTAVNIISGLIVVFFGLNFLGVFKLNLFKGMQGSVKTDNMGFFSALLFGVVFSVGWTPCVGAFLGSALMLASQQGHVLQGVLMLLSYSLGLGIPFVLSAVLIDYLKTAFNWIKRNYNVINTVSGGALVLIGILMMTGYMERLLGLIS